MERIRIKIRIRIRSRKITEEFLLALICGP